MSKPERLTFEMNGKEVEALPFKVHMADGTERYYPQSEEIMYIWAVGMTGELNIQRAEFHTKFSAKIGETRISAIANGHWKEVEVIYDDEGESLVH